MKKIFFACIIMVAALYSSAQTKAVQKFDTVYMKSSEIKIGSITAMNDVSIDFVHKGETLSYTLKKPDIVKIVFSSGRVEMINDPEASKAAVAPVDHHNKAAVLPFNYINTQQENNPEMGFKVQQECYTFLSNKSVSLQIQDPVTTNAMLGKAGITPENIRNYTMPELCNILGVAYVLRGTVTSNMSSVTSSGNASYNAKDGSSADKNGVSNKSSGSVYASNTTQENFRTSVLMEIYTDEGKKVYGQDRTSFWTTVDAYKNTLQFLLKKTPIYGL